MKRTALILLLMSAPACAGGEGPGRVVQFADWSAACDNAGHCEAVSLSAGMQWRRGEGWLASPGEAVLRIVRDPAADAPARMVVDHRMGGLHQSRERLLLRPVTPGDTDRARAGFPLVAGEPGVEELAPGQIAAFIAESGGAREAEVLAADAPGHRRARISTDGMMAALRHIDEVQGRTRTTGALVARGPRPSAARRWPSPPVIHVVPGEGGREASHRFPGASFDAPSGLMTLRENLAPPAGRIANFGNCGRIRTYAWTGRTFVLAQQVEMPACAGIAPPYWLVTFRSSLLTD